MDEPSWTSWQEPEAELDYHGLTASAPCLMSSALSSSANAGDRMVEGPASELIVRAKFRNDSNEIAVKVVSNRLEGQKCFRLLVT